MWYKDVTIQLRHDDAIWCGDVMCDTSSVAQWCDVLLQWYGGMHGVVWMKGQSVAVYSRNLVM